MGMLVSILIGALAGIIAGKLKGMSLWLLLIMGAIDGFLGSFLFGVMCLSISSSFWGQLLAGFLGVTVFLLLALLLLNKKVRIIRWYIDSNPNGADIAWRVISTTPKVQNTNMNYVGTTPYETTETLSIKGLTKANSNKVQIEVCCEKAGYISQKKRFNLGQVIEQYEITTKFNLIKDV